MSDTGAQGELLVRLGSGTPTVDIAAPGLGLTTWQRAYPYGTAEGGGSGDYVEQQNTPYRRGSWTFTIPETAASRRLFWMKSLLRATIWDSPKKEATEPQYRGEGLLSVGWTANGEEPRSFAVTLTVDGAITAHDISAEAEEGEDGNS